MDEEGGACWANTLGGFPSQFSLSGFDVAFNFAACQQPVFSFRSLSELSIFCSSNPATSHQTVDVGTPALYRSLSTVCARLEAFRVFDCHTPARRVSPTRLRWRRIVPSPGQLASWCLQLRLLQTMPRSLTVGRIQSALGLA